MRQFILTVGTLVSALLSCWCIWQGISSILKDELERSLLFLLIASPLLLSITVALDYVNSCMHEDYRKLRSSLARRKGAQKDLLHPHSREVRHTPWEDDSSHTH